MSVDAILQGQNYTTTEEDTLLADKAPTNHRSTNNTYGVGNDTYFGHVKLWDTPTGVYGTGTGFAITPKGLQEGLDTKAPTNHRSSSDTYGTGNATYFGHVKLLTSHESTATVGEGIAATPLAVKQVYDAIPSAYTSTPKALGTATAGTSTSWARGDHVHAMPSPADIGAAASGDIPSAYTSTPKHLGTASAGTSTSWARGDHVHKLPSPADIGAAASGDIPSSYASNPAQIASSASAGTSTSWARGDHVHKVASLSVISEVIASAATPKPLGTATAGTFLMCSRADHVHRMPTQTELAAVVGSNNNPSALSKTASSGTSTALSREDHVHPTWYDSFISTDLIHGSTVQLNTNNTAHAILLFVNTAKSAGASGGFCCAYFLSGYGAPTATTGTDFTQKRASKSFATATYVTVAGNQNGWSVTNTGSSVDAMITAIVLNGTVNLPTS